jgi:tRNA (guanine37-N1)-methyltransferase
VVARARTRGTIEIGVRDLRAFTDDRHRTVDDMPHSRRAGHGDEAGALSRAVDAVVAERDGRMR